MKKYILSCLLVLLSASQAMAKLVDLSSFKLANGLEVVVIENHKAPVALNMLYYKTGSVNDPKGKGGIAHLLEHMMFRGTKALPDQKFNNLMEKYGAENNAYTTYNETGYYEFADISKLELMLALEADRMRGISFDNNAFIKERDIVLQERKQRYETNPVSLFYEILNQTLWQSAPLANPVSGKEEEIISLTVDDAKAFYDKYYHPNNAVLVLAGDVTENEVKPVVDKYFGSITGKDKGDALTFVNPRDVNADMIIRLDGITQPRYAEYIRINAGELNKKDVLALEFLAEYLAGDDTSYLSEKLVYGSKKLLGINVGLSYTENLGGSLALYAVPAEETLSINEIKEMLSENIILGLKALTDEKLQKIKNQILSDTIYMQENPESSARFVGGMLLDGYTIEEISDYDTAIKQITIADVLEAWEKISAKKARVSGYLTGPTDTINKE